MLTQISFKEDWQDTMSFSIAAVGMQVVNVAVR